MKQAISTLDLRRWRLVEPAPHNDDTQCGFKLFTRQAADELFGLAHADRYAFDLELLTLAQRATA